MKRILVSVGTQLPFSRLLTSVHQWSTQTELEHLIFAQTAENGKVYGFYEEQAYMSAEKFSDLFESCDCIVSHAGMGNIISALELGKEIIIMPRLSVNAEHRNNHQVGTGEKFKHLTNVSIVNSYDELSAALHGVFADKRTPNSVLGSSRESELGRNVRKWIYDSCNL